MREFKDSITGKDSADSDAPAERATLARAEEPARSSETAAPTADQRS